MNKLIYCCLAIFLLYGCTTLRPDKSDVIPKQQTPIWIQPPVGVIITYYPNGRHIK